MRIERVISNKGAEVLTIAPNASVGDAAILLSEKRIGAVVVCVPGEAPEGILSERDIVRELGRSGAGCLQQTVADLMTRDIRTCGLSDALDDVLSIMTEGRFRHMPVIADGQMVGIVSIGDIVKSRLNELSMERDALEGMVMGH
ncbi:CBS domain-containing protein [Palleronia marisminoris]|uniref:Hypoxic response protein 1 n=1 Tax=Palleronia marisminoris TaxID=315423 RepID=A0A1Y5RJX9_9RHOB|nr:CBS domain-containing protein [Palleronia marisminoris]SFG22761.1 CBS domain-containing protein [Palleronia marisminoris]SLN18113.1 Hypoxic response protein 1 [Palleronia marisminoris]